MTGSKGRRGGPGTELLPPGVRTRSELCGTHAEEMANAITHGAGALLGVAALVIMLVFSTRYGTALDVVTSLLFCGSMIAVYVISAAYHLVTDPRKKAVLQMWDRASIFVMIAGSYAPITLGVLRGAWGWTLFGGVWALAFVGIYFTMTRFEKFQKAGVVLYVVMGWLALTAIGKLIALMPGGALALLVAGGVSYTSGLIFFRWTRLKYNHSVWHLFVLAGSVCHFFAFLALIPRP